MIKRNPLVRVQRSIKLSRLKRLKRKPKRVKTLAEISSLREKIRLRKHAEKVHASIATKKQFRKNPLRADSAARREKILSEISEYQKQLEKKRANLKKQRRV